jgi:PPOX class probable FMN-dependent enzyme
MSTGVEQQRDHGGPDQWSEISTADQITALIGEPLASTRAKERDRLHDLDLQWLAVSPFCVVATSDVDGNLDASPKGDPAGQLAYVIDDRTIAIAERPGNRRADGYHNILSNPHVGLIFFIPGRGDTLRINGRARLVSDAPFFDQMIVKGHRPLLAVVVEIETIFHHCAKAFLRSGLWKPETWRPEAMPSRAELAKAMDKPDEDLDALRSYYDDANYAKKLYAG